MISFITGTVHEIFDHSMIVLVNGIGYEIIAPASVLQLLAPEQETALYIHHHIREDQQTLYGFSTLAERDLFRQFLSVSGIGPKSGLAALSAAPRQELIRAIQLEDHSVFQSVSGIGPKTAKRLVLELKSKVEWDEVVSPLSTEQPSNSVRTDLLLALEQLGYQPRQVEPVISQLQLQDLSLEDALKEVLAQLR